MPGEPQPGDGQSGQARKSYQEILAQEIEQGRAESERRKRGLFLSGLSAGLELGFGPFLMAVMLTEGRGSLPPPIMQLLLASLYSVGFILVIFGRSELFTEHTTLSILPVLAGRSPLRALLRLWGIVYAANLVGAALFAANMAALGPALGVIGEGSLAHLARDMTAHAPAVILASGVLAGWLMGLVSWLVTAGRDTVGQIIFVWIVTSAIGFGGLHHCIAGTVEVLPAVLLGLDVSWGEFGRFLLWTTLGNAAGGGVFVALLKYGHAIFGEAGAGEGAASP